MKILKQVLTAIGIGGILMATACHTPGHNRTADAGLKTDTVIKTVKNWQQELDAKLPLLGHRNWILIVDKAFPEQNAIGMDYLYADEHLLPVLKHVLDKISHSTHVKPIIYQDKELGYIREDQAKGVKQFLQDSKVIFGNQNVQSLLHNEVFKKLDSESKLFKVLVIKTNETIPYTSVFMQLDCAYWDANKEEVLRGNMK